MSNAVKPAKYAGKTQGPTMEELLAENERLKAQLDEAQAAPDFGGSSGYGGQRSMATTTTKKTWPFRVTHLAGPQGCSLPPKEFDVVDESEAIRLYCLDNTWKGKTLDTTRHTFKVECLKRAERAEHSRKARLERNAARYPDGEPGVVRAR